MLTPVAKLDHGAFDTVFKLITKQQWLSSRSKALIELYNLCETKNQEELVIDLLERFKYLDSTLLNRNGEVIAEHMTKSWNCTADNCLLIAVADKDEAKIDGSQGLLQALKDKLAPADFSNDNFIPTIGQGSHKIRPGQIAILFDDFIGSGETMERKVNWFIDRMKNLKKQDVEIKILSYAIMNFALSRLTALGKDIFSPEILEKGISDHYKDPEREQYLQEMLLLEDKLEEVCKSLPIRSYSLGYNKSEAIYKLDGYNVSDNVFPIFWWPELKVKEKRSTLFNRIN